MSLLPNTPYEALKISNPVLKGIAALVTKSAEIFGFWVRPRKGAAGEVSEMNLLDNLYWVYKSKNPVQLPEPELQTSEFMQAKHAQLAPRAEGEKVERLALSFAGDILRTHRAEPAQDQVYAQIEDLLFKNDIVIANYESPVTTQPLVDEVIGDAGPPVECASEDQFDALTCHKGRAIDVLNLANNHIFDMGIEGVETTLATLAKRNILPIGVSHAPADPDTANIIERNGIKIGFASCAFGTNGQTLPDGHGYNVNLAKLISKHQPPDIELLKTQISNAKAAECDLIIAVLHWGHEFELFPRRVQQEAAEELAEFGADIIVCHHPHVPQPIQLYRLKSDADKTVPIAYSLGSLLWGFSHEDIASSVILQAEVQKAGGKTTLTSVTATPVRWFAHESEGRIIQRVEQRAD